MSTMWWKSTLRMVAVGTTLAGAGWMALNEPPKANEPRWVVTSTRAS